MTADTGRRTPRATGRTTAPPGSRARGRPCPLPGGRRDLPPLPAGRRAGDRTYRGAPPRPDRPRPDPHRVPPGARASPPHPDAAGPRPLVATPLRVAAHRHCRHRPGRLSAPHRRRPRAGQATRARQLPTAGHLTARTAGGDRTAGREQRHRPAAHHQSHGTGRPGLPPRPGHRRRTVRRRGQLPCPTTRTPPRIRPAHRPRAARLPTARPALPFPPGPHRRRSRRLPRTRSPARALRRTAEAAREPPTATAC